MERNENVKKANEELEYLSGDAAERRKAELREKYKKDITSAREHGIRIGVKKEKFEIAKVMLKENASIDFISKITGFTKEEIENIKEE